ncbi:hypothetical protein, partial [Streptomyces albus]|uniref:hypothetical protein n=1 Tax=Streptomyces albus TaxID=1888 RepID=UPI00196A1522
MDSWLGAVLLVAVVVALVMSLAKVNRARRRTRPAGATRRPWDRGGSGEGSRDSWWAGDGSSGGSGSGGVAFAVDSPSGDDSSSGDGSPGGDVSGGGGASDGGSS